MHCYYHPETEGVVQCAKCGITLCRECEENSLFRTDHGTGQAVCLRCSQQIAQEIVDSKTAWLKNRKTKLTICTPLILLGLLCGTAILFFYSALPASSSASAILRHHKRKKKLWLTLS